MTLEEVTEPARDIGVLDEVDVLVAGGGVSGCAAAVSAARAGAKTTLVERNGCLGGVATATLMANIGNRFLTASGEQAIHGFAGELIDRLVAAGAASPNWKNREVPGVVIDSERLKVVFIECLEEAGVKVLTHTLGARPIMDGRRVGGLFVESHAGRQAILAKATVDATGEADVVWQAGAVMDPHTKGTATTLFKLTRVDLDRFVDFLQQDPDGFPAGLDGVKDLETFTRNWRERGVLFFPHLGGKEWRFLRQAIEAGKMKDRIDIAYDLNAMGMYAVRGCGNLVVNSNFYRVSSLDAEDISRFELHAQKMCYYAADFLIRNVPGFENARVEHVGVDLGVRTSRKIDGRFALQREVTRGASGPTCFDDVVGVTPVSSDFRKTGRFYEDYTADVPFGILVPKGVENVLVGSGKSASTVVRGLLRGMSSCMICGQAAGVASALAARQGISSTDVPVRELQKELIRQEVRLGSGERLKELGLG